MIMSSRNDSNKANNEIVKKSWDDKLPLNMNILNAFEALNKWNTIKFGNIFHKKKSLLARIAGIQKRLDQNYMPGLIRLDTKLKK